MDLTQDEKDAARHDAHQALLRAAKELKTAQKLLQRAGCTTTVNLYLQPAREAIASTAEFIKKLGS